VPRSRTALNANHRKAGKRNDEGGRPVNGWPPKPSEGKPSLAVGSRARVVVHGRCFESIGGQRSTFPSRGGLEVAAPGRRDSCSRCAGSIST
jgi:hypothetical protein